MNNNMPNNFNNGLPNNNPVNNVPNVAQNTANQQLMGGQSTIGNQPNVMQGVPNVQNENGVAQGIGNVQNTPNIMQGSVAPEVKPEESVSIPGQGNSGINAFNMAKEQPKEEPGVVSIPSFAPNIPETPAPQMPNQNMNVNQMPNNPLNNQIGTPDLNLVNEPIMPNAQQQPINQNLNGIVNEMPINNGMPINNEMQNINMAPPVNNIGINPEPAPLNSLNNQIGEPSANQGISQVGQTELNSMANDMAEMPEMPEKKFPLSVREMVLIGIALVGIVVVLIVYL